MADKLSDKHVLGMVLFVMSETVFFMVLILAFVFYRNSPANASSATFWLAGRHHRRGHSWRWHAWLLLTMLLGGAFIYGEAREFADMSSQGIVPASDLFGSTFYALVGFHGFHVSMGLIILLIVLVLSVGTPHFRGGRHAMALDAISVYWIFVDAMWWIIFPTVYLLS